MKARVLINFGIWVSLFYLILMIARMVLPFGDEPDFGFRINSIIFSEKSFLNPFFYFENLFASFDWLDSEVESFTMKLFRVNWTFYLILFTLFFTYIVAKTYYKFQSCNIRAEFKRSYQVLLLSILFPSIWFHLGLLAEEQFTLLLSMLAIFFRRSLIGLVFIGLLISFIDFGNSIVYFVFILFYLAFKFTIDKGGYKLGFLVLIFMFVMALVVKMEAVKLLSYLPLIGAKASVIYDHYTNIYDVNDKYPLILRPIITYMSIVFMLPNSLTLFFLPYLTVLIASLLLIFRLNNKNKYLFKLDLFQKDFAFFLAGIAIVLVFPVVLPGFSNGKYYVFLIPFFIIIFSYFFTLNKILYFILFLNFLVFSQLMFGLV